MGMIHQLMNKWFGLTDPPCETCEVLRERLSHSERERAELLQRVLVRNEPEPLIEEKEEFKPITPQFTPWRVRQQMLEAEDRKAAQLMRDRKKEIDALEKELDIVPEKKDASEKREAI